ncbi:MAG: hypothetical protein IJO73_04445 [Clostridia bacterium]|nr:hypothetical protein [Clostridia bacterium]
MKTSKRIIVFSMVLFFIISVSLIVAVFFKSTVDADFEDFSMLLNTVKVFLLISSSFFVLLLLIKQKERINLNTEKVFLIFSVIIYSGLFLAGVSAFSGYNSRSGVFCSSELNWDNVNVDRYLPYNEVFKRNSSDDVYYEVSKTSVNGFVYVHAINDVMNGIDYKAEYFDSSSYLMNFKFISDRTVSSAFNDFDAEVTGEFATEFIDDLECDIYVDGNDYYLVIADEKSSFFSSVTDNEELIVSLDDFKENAIKQFYLMKEAVSLGKYKL